MTPRTGLLILATLVITASPSEAYIYWVEAGSNLVRRAENDGSAIVDLAGMTLFRADFADVDADAGLIYWADPSPDEIWRANLDGSDPERLIQQPDLDPYGIAVDPPRGTFYFTQQSGSGIWRANLDGSALEQLHDGAMEPQGIAVNSTAGRVYWCDSQADAVLEADLELATIDTLVSGLDQPIDVAVDETTGRVYITEAQTEIVVRVDADGSNRVDYADMDLPPWFNLRGIDVDPARDVVFYTSDRIAGHLHRMSRDGGSRNFVIDDQNFGPVGVAADTSTGLFYWWHNGDRVIYETDPFVGDFAPAVVGMMSPRTLAYDVAGSTLFWGDRTAVFAVGDDGSGFRRFADGIDGDVHAVAIAESLGKLYWITDDDVFRANLDGSMVEPLNVGCSISNPSSLVVDENGGFVYWTRIGGFLQRAALDGSGCTDVPITVVDSEQPMVLDPDGGGVYLAGRVDGGSTGIYRLDFATTTPEEIVPSTLVRAIAVHADKLYWCDSSSIFRANRADGSESEPVVVGVISPFGLVVDGATTPIQTISWSEFKQRF